MKKAYTLLTICFCSIYSYSQVGINTDSPLSTLHIKESRLEDNTNQISKADGILIPKLTKAELALKATNTYQSSEHEGVLVYITEVSENISGPSESKVININSTGYYFLNAQNLWEPIYGLGIDSSDDAWINNPSQTRVELGYNSNNETRNPGSEVVITDDGNFGIGTAFPTKRLEINASNNENLTDFIKLDNLAFPPENTKTSTLQIDENGFVSQLDEENIEGKILRLPLAYEPNILPNQNKILKLEQTPLLSPNLTQNLITLLPGYVKNSDTEFTLPAGLYKYEVRLIGYFSQEDPKNSISFSTYVNNSKYSVHYYGSNSRIGFNSDGTINQHYTSSIISDFIELSAPSKIKFELKNNSPFNFTVRHYVGLSGQRSYRSVILFQRIK